MKRILLMLLLIPLVLIEVYLCTVFLPVDWQRTLDNQIARILPESHDSTPITHPNINQEIEQVLSKHIWLKIALDVVAIVLLVANTLAIRMVWRLLRGGRIAAEIG
jgi:hypothetical protein